MTAVRGWSALVEAADDPAALDRDAALVAAMELGTRLSASSVGCSVTQQLDGGFVTPVASGPLAVELDQAQYDARVGPCVAATLDHRVHRVPDMTADDRYTAFSAAAAQRGVRSSVSIPLPGTDRPAALNLYAGAVGALAGGRPFAVAALLARCVAALLTTSGATKAPPADALAAHDLMIRAGALLARRDDVDPRTAFRSMTATSTTDGVSIFDVARGIVARGIVARGNVATDGGDPAP